MDKNVYKKSTFLEKRYWQIVKTWGGGNKQKTNQKNKTKPQQFFNSVCKHFIKIEILTLQAVFPDKLFK